MRNNKQQRKRKSKRSRNKSNFWDRLSSMVQRRSFTRMRKQIQHKIWLKILNLSNNQMKREKDQSKGKVTTTKGPRNPRRNRNRDKTYA